MKRNPTKVNLQKPTWSLPDNHLDAIYFAGFIEGEGHLSAIIRRVPFKAKVSIGVEWGQTQHKDGLPLLIRLNSLINDVGILAPKTGDSNIWTLRVRGKQNIRNLIIPFYYQYVLSRTCKLNQFLLFEQILSKQEQGYHLQSYDNLWEVVSLAYDLTDYGKGKRRSIPRDQMKSWVLRGHMPE